MEERHPLPLRLRPTTGRKPAPLLIVLIFACPSPSGFVFFGGYVALLGPEGKRSPLDPIPRLVESAGIEMKRGVVGRRSGLKLTTPSVNVFVITACTAYK
jgi:hypothetical protein